MFSMVKVLTYGSSVINMKDNGRMEPWRAMEPFSWKTVAISLVSGKRVNKMEKVDSKPRMANIHSKGSIKMV